MVIYFLSCITRRQTTSLHASMTMVAGLCLAPLSVAAEIGKGKVYSVVEVRFVGPRQTARQTPARDIDFRVTFRHERGKPEYTVYGF